MAALNLSTMFATNDDEGQNQKEAGDQLVFKFKYLDIIELLLRTIGSLALSSFFRTQRQTSIYSDQSKTPPPPAEQLGLTGARARLPKLWTRRIYLIRYNSEFLVRNPVQAALQSNKRLKAKHFFECFCLGMTLRPKGSRNLFQICSKSTRD